MLIFNMTQHDATDEQIKAGVIARASYEAEQVQKLLTFTKPPSAGEIKARAEKIAELAAEWRTSASIVAANNYARDYVRDGEWIPPASYFEGDYSAVMVGGAPYLMRPLEEALEKKGFTPLYAYSERVSMEETLLDGSVKKVNVFRHVCFI